MNRLKNLLFAIACASFMLVVSQDHSSININEVTINQHTVFGITTNSLITIFGEPLNIENDFLEMENATAQIYNYEGASFWFSNKKLVYFKITGNNYYFLNNNLAVGQNINNVEPLFPLSFANKSNNALIINAN